MKNFVDLLENSIKKRVESCERNICCLLSGGLDSSIISAYVARFQKKSFQIENWKHIVSVLKMQLISNIRLWWQNTLVLSMLKL